MLLKRLPETSKEWVKFINDALTDRCDLDILLKDKWRHKILVRDLPQSLYSMKQCKINIDGKNYDKLKTVLRKKKKISLRAIAITVLHVVLRAYGHGNQTVFAVLEPANKQSQFHYDKLLPVFTDHTQQSMLPSIKTIEKIEKRLQRKSSFVNQSTLLQHGLFDSAIAIAGPDSVLPNKSIFPLTSLICDDEINNCLEWTIFYAEELFENDVIKSVLDVIYEVFNQIISSPYRLLRNLEFLSETQKQQLRIWNDTEDNFSDQLRLNELVELATQKTPHLEAIIFEDKSITFSQLDILANNFASWLTEHNKQALTNEIIALYMDKSDIVATAILGIWKAGAAFVPVDPSYPVDRIRFIIGDTKAKIIIANTHYIERLQTILEPILQDIQIVEVESVLESQNYGKKNLNRKTNLVLNSGGLAYITYTSGTTGVPKGVPKLHRSVVNSITDLSNRYDMLRPGTERVALFSSYVFEPFIRQMLIALINSQTLVVVSEKIKLDPDLLPAFLHEQKITYLNGTGSVLQHFNLKNLIHLKRLLLVGEELTTTALRQLREKFYGEIINEYAFTETAFVTAIKRFSSGEIERFDRSIGRPLRNVKCYVLSQDLKQLPIGAIGDLYIGGIGVSSGYINRDDLTKERFLDNPFQTADEKRFDKNAKIYKTGDLARILSNGELEYMGRSDFQLKLNGIRVEPGEIEAVAATFPGIKKCVVVPREIDNGDRYLVGYFVAEEKVDEQVLIAYLEEHLIRIMVPARMVQLPTISININGKVDRNSLPEVSISRANLSIHSDKPSFVLSKAANAPKFLNTIIHTLNSIWSDILGIPKNKISLDDDFFRLGGQSILCILLIANVRKKLGLNLGLDDIFNLRTIQNISSYLEKQTPIYNTSVLSLENLHLGQSLALPASGLQQSLLYHSMKALQFDDAYIVQSVYHYYTKIEPELFHAAWQRALYKYPALRLRFEWGNEPIQIIDSEPKKLDWHFEDLSNEQNKGNQEAQIRELRENDCLKGYKITEGPLFRVYLIKQSDTKFTLIFSCHHIIIDGWSLPILHDYIHRTYLSLLNKETPKLEEDTAYIAAQQYWATHIDDYTKYWLEQVESIGDRCDLTGLLNTKSRYKVDLTSYGQILDRKGKKIKLTRDNTLALKSLCTDNHLTLHSLLQFVWHKILNSIGAGQFTVVGTIVSGRNLPIDGIEHSVGLFINTLPLIVDHFKQENKSVVSAIRDIQAAVNLMNSYSLVSLGRLQNGGMKRNLFDTLLVLENYQHLIGNQESNTHKELLNFEVNYDVDRVDHPLTVVAREEGEELVITIWYAGELFNDETIDDLLDSMNLLFKQLIVDVSIPVYQLELCSKKALACFEKWNETEKVFDKKITLHKIFERTAAHWSNSVAIAYEDVELLYGELDKAANQLANYLLTVFPLKPNDLVALVLDKSEKMILAILAVWKSGAAYVPIDPSFPDERISFILDDTKARIILTNSVYAKKIKSFAQSSQTVLEIETLTLSDQLCTAPITHVTSTDLAYAIYTSGTTGKPKAVLVEHQGVVNLQESLAQIFSLSKHIGEEAFLSFSNYVFDHFVEQMLDALLNGQKLVILNDDMRADQARLLAYISRHQVTYLSGTPSVLSLYNFSEANSLTRIDAIGEDFTEAVFNKIRRTFKGIIINGYGPTEVSITTHKRIYNLDETRLNKSIGYPVANTKCYVLNKSMKPVPIGGIGELYIGGIGVTRGYLNQDRLTGERFLSNPFQTKEEKGRGLNSLIYKTGDLARWLANGELEYLGRTDLQVKIRGQRVELGEIESILTSYSGISRSFIIVREQSQNDASLPSHKYLVGFYLSDKILDEQDIKRYMRTKLSEAIIPARILRIENIPVTANGKLDIKQLPPTDFTLDSAVEYIAPSSHIEIKLCDIWSKILGINADLISTYDDFFGLGGDSIRAISLAQSIKNTFGSNFPVHVVFNHVTIAQQAQYIHQLHKNPEVTYPEVDSFKLVNTDLIPASLAQQRLLFIDEFEGGSAAYNISLCLEIEGDNTYFEACLKEALSKIICRHQALRTLLKKVQTGSYIQNVLNETEALSLFQITELTFKNKAELDKTLIGRTEYLFSLDKELPIRLGLFRCIDITDKIYLDIVVHHTCFDGWSWNIFQKELKTLVTGISESTLTEQRASYTDFTIWQRQRLSGDVLFQLSEFWTKFLENSEAAQLPIDNLRPVKFDYRGKEIDFKIDQNTTIHLKKLARASRVSLYSVLLGAYCLMINVFNKQNDFIVGTPYANRGQAEFDNIIGFFANLLALRIKIDHDSTIKDYIHLVGSVVIKAQIHNEMPFEELIRCLDIQNDTSRNPIVQLIFTLQDAITLEDQIGITNVVMNPYKPENDGLTLTKFDATTTLIEIDGELLGNFTYAASLFNECSVKQFISTFQHILKEFTRLSQLYDTAKIADILLVDIHQVERPLYDEKYQTQLSLKNYYQTAHHVFEQIVAEHGELVAITSKDGGLLYKELDKQANQLANYLAATKSLQPNDFIALVLDKSEKTIIAILAIWKCGVAYVPIDPNFPDERISFMLEDTQARIILTNNIHGQRIRSLIKSFQPILEIETISLDNQLSIPPVTQVRSSDVAYAIYTSGTTGKPKAVLIEHRNLLSFLSSIRSLYNQPNPKGQERILFTSNYVFDFSVEQIALSILCGNILIIPGSLSFQDDEFYDLMNQENLTYLSGTPTQIDHIDLSRLKSLRMILVAGEPFQYHHFNKIKYSYSGQLYCAYGTTETTVYNTVISFDLQKEYVNSLGIPLPNTRLYILGDRMELLPYGAIGELYLSGECVARGYLNQSELTKQVFIANPYQLEQERIEGKCSVIYKTGDLVRHHLCGRIEYIRRNDEQIKINGIRVEPAEIEAVLAQYPSIKQCAVIASKDNNASNKQQLVGYFLTKNDVVLEQSKILAFLQKSLIPSMIPWKLIQVKGQLPMTINGKLDTRALPKISGLQKHTPYTPPRNRLDARLCNLWRMYLNNIEIGIDDNFFRCGGDSIKAMILTSILQKELKQNISVKNLFDFPTIHEFADNVVDKSTINHHLNDINIRGSMEPLTGLCPMLPIQKWFFTLPLLRPQHWNQYFTVRTPKLDIEKLRHALVKLTEYHDVFHLRYKTYKNDGLETVEQFYTAPNRDILLNALNVSSLSDAEIQNKLQKWQDIFDLEKGPIWSIAYLYGYNDGSARVWFAMHHLIVDTVSWQILARDLEILYYEGNLGYKNCNYRDWVQAVQNYSPTSDEKQFWHDLALATQEDAKKNVYINKLFPIERVHFQLGTDDTQTLLTESNQAYDTHINDLLLTAVGFALRNINQRSTNYVTLESHGRALFDNLPDVRDTVGWFTTMYPFALEVSESIEKSILNIKLNRTKVPNQGIGYSVLQGIYGSPSAPLPLISFNYLGQLSGQATVKEELEEKGWRLDTTMCGVSKDLTNETGNSSIIDLTISVTRGQMEVTIESKLGYKITYQLMQEFKKSLEDIIFHTLSILPDKNVSKNLPSSSLSSTDFVPYILSNEDKNPALFILPPGEGGAESYLNNIAKHLNNVKLVIFNNIHLLNPMDSFEDLAEYYVEHIKSIQPNGPYNFLGWSFGGVLALEIALKLSKRGDKINNLFFIDPYFDVRYASETVGLQAVRDILDPINYHYNPNIDDLKKLRTATNNVLLFKAAKPNNVFNKESQKLLFDYYHRSYFNNLDRLLPPEGISLEILHDDTHHSWVQNEQEVIRMSVNIFTALQASSNL